VSEAVRHPVVFVEIAVPDVAAASAFYVAALGWSVVEVRDRILESDAGPVMFRCHTGAKPNLGLVRGRAGTGGTTVFILTDDLEESSRSWTAAGGTVGASEGFLELGTRRRCVDPWGNAVALWTWAPDRGWRPQPG